MTHAHDSRSGTKLALFLAISCLGSWFVAATIRVFEIGLAPHPLATRFLTTALLYALTTGWPPFLAAWLLSRSGPPEDLDLGLRPTRAGFSVVGATMAIALVAGAAILAVAFGESTLPSASGSAEGATVLGIVVLVAAFIGSITTLTLQAITEEIGWRGYLLAHAMRRFGAWRGLVLHAAAWGACYAPVVFLFTYDAESPETSLLRGGATLVTCVMLGMLLGWLRLAANGLGPAVVANVTFTVATALPYLLQGHDAGLRAAATGPFGWPFAAVVLLALAGSRWRTAVRIPVTTARSDAAGPSRAVIERVALLLERSPRAPNRYGPN